MFKLRLWFMIQLLRWTNSTANRRELAEGRAGKLARKFNALLVALRHAYDNVDCHIETNGEERVQAIIAAAQPKIVFDVGANKGDWSNAFLARGSSSTIYAFEPIAETYEMLRAAVPTVRSFRIALGAENGQAVFGKGGILDGSSKYAEATQHFTGYETIEVRRGDDFVAEHDIAQIDYLKIDAEGMDYEVLQGFQKTIEAGKIRIIQFEYSQKNIESHTFLKDCYKLLSAHYLIGKIYPREVEFRDYDHDQEDFMLGNYLCLRRDSLELVPKLKNESPS